MHCFNLPKKKNLKVNITLSFKKKLVGHFNLNHGQIAKKRILTAIIIHKIHLLFAFVFVSVFSQQTLSWFYLLKIWTYKKRIWLNKNELSEQT